jgi:zinc D-Ala-D-Ala carboxypeptidase
MGAISQHFSAAELACHHCGENECNPSLVDALEALRAIVGVPIAVDDAYRCATHNAAVGGVKNSEHELGLAADIRIAGMTPAAMYVAALKVPAFADGGIGVAEGHGYIHVDTRPRKARWCYDAAGRPCIWDAKLDAAVQA